MSGSSLRIEVRLCRTEAESSTISTRTFCFCMGLGPDHSYFENGWLNLLQLERSVLDHRFRMPDDQIAARPQVAAKPFDHLGLGRFVEIDQNVPAKDDVNVA